MYHEEMYLNNNTFRCHFSVDSGHIVNS